MDGHSDRTLRVGPSKAVPVETVSCWLTDSMSVHTYAVSRSTPVRAICAANTSRTVLNGISHGWMRKAVGAPTHEAPLVSTRSERSSYMEHLWDTVSGLTMSSTHCRADMSGLAAHFMLYHATTKP